jgi:hypothetical protein
VSRFSFGTPFLFRQGRIEAGIIVAPRSGDVAELPLRDPELVVDGAELAPDLAAPLLKPDEAPRGLHGELFEPWPHGCGRHVNQRASVAHFTPPFTSTRRSRRSRSAVGTAVSGIGSPAGQVVQDALELEVLRMIRRRVPFHDRVVDGILKPQ